VVTCHLVRGGWSRPRYLFAEQVLKLRSAVLQSLPCVLEGGLPCTPHPRKRTASNMPIVGGHSSWIVRFGAERALDAEISSNIVLATFGDG
jgi:hypothetical protein